MGHLNSITSVVHNEEKAREGRKIGSIACTHPKSLCRLKISNKHISGSIGETPETNVANIDIINSYQQVKKLSGLSVLIIAHLSVMSTWIRRMNILEVW